MSGPELPRSVVLNRKGLKANCIAKVIWNEELVHKNPRAKRGSSRKEWWLFVRPQDVCRACRSAQVQIGCAMGGSLYVFSSSLLPSLASHSDRESARFTLGLSSPVTFLSISYSRETYTSLTIEEKIRIEHKDVVQYSLSIGQ